MTSAATDADLDHGQERPERLPERARVVVKVGSSPLTRADGRPDLNRIDIPVGLTAGMRSRGHDVVLVSSGAITSGLMPLGLSRRPDELSFLQVAAFAGQGRLATHWEIAMSAYGLVTAQVLLTAHDVVIRSHYRMVRATFDSLLSLGAVPIINENDAAATSKFSLGDNDRLAAPVAHLVTADVLVLLTDVDGLRTAYPGTPGATPIRHVRPSAGLTGVSVSGCGSFVGADGMTTKLQVATIVCASGTAALIARADDAVAFLGQEQVPVDLGTRFGPTDPYRPSCRLWMAHVSRPGGCVLIDAGAARVLTVGKKPLLLPGLTGLEGDFESGFVVDVVGPEGVLVRGICRYAAAELRKVLAVRAEGAPAPDYVAPVIYRDGLAELPHIAGV